MAQPADGPKKPSYPIGSVDSALRLLLIVAERKQLRASDAADELGCARSTAHRLLQMLQFYSFVDQDPQTKAYVPGSALVKIGMDTVRGIDIRAVARPHIERLVREMEETVHLLEFQGSDAMFCLDSIESPRALRVGARSGMTLPPYASAAGRSILALLPEEEVRAMYPSASFPARHPATITKRSQLLAELDKARARGYAVQRSETEDGISAVAAAIEQDGVRPRFAVTVAVPTSRLTDEEVPTIGAAVVACAAAISASLGA